MTRKLAISALLLLATSTLAQTLPQGHPPMGATGSPAGTAQLPPGHPPMGSMGGMGGPTGQMPKNHPSLEDMLAAQAAKNPGASTQPAPTGTLTLEALSGSANGTSPANEKATVELYLNGTVLKKLDLAFDANARLVVKDIPLMPPVQALVSINHGGLLQQAITPEINPDNPNPSLQIKVYDATETAPAWSVAMQHMILQWAQDGSAVHVVEMISANSPSDRAWLGNKVGDKRVTLSIPIAPTATNLELGGSFDENNTTLAEGKLVTGSALFPGRSQFRISYDVPVTNGAVDLPIGAPNTVDNMIVFFPDDAVQVSASGDLTGGQAVDMGPQGKVRMFRGANLKPGLIATLAIKGITAAPAEVETAAIATPSKFSPANIALAAAFFMVLVGAGMIFVKKPQPKKA